MLRCTLTTVVAVLVAVAFAGAVPGAEPPAGGGWPQFLGPQRNGISAETGLLANWPAGGPKVLWRVPGGVGMAAVSVLDGSAVTVVQRDGDETVVCLDARTGEEQWATPIAPAYSNGQGNGTRATPTIHAKQVFVYTGDGTLAALDFATGKTAWKLNAVSELDGRIADYGMASSPLIVGKLVVVTVGAPGGCVAAFQQSDGKLAWKSGNDPAGYSSPALLTLGQTEQVVAFNGAAAVGHAVTDGVVLWRYAFETDFDCNIATPIAVDGKLFISAGENHGCVMLNIEKTGKQFRVSEAWSSLGPRSVMRNGWQTCLHLGDYLYGYDNVGAAGPIMHLTCLNATSGEVVWQKTRFGKGNCIAADGKLFCSSMAGELIVVRATPDEYQELGRMKVMGEGNRQAPALANGLLYLRDDEEILCIDVRKQSE